MNSTDHDSNDYDCGKYGERGQPAGLPDLSQPSMLDELLAVLCVPRLPTREEQEARWAQEALADLAVPTPAELDHWSAQLAEEATCEARRHRKFPTNPHDD